MADTTYCPVCNLHLGPEDRRSHDIVCPALLEKPTRIPPSCLLVRWENGEVVVTGFAKWALVIGRETGGARYPASDMAKWLEYIGAEVERYARETTA